MSAILEKLRQKALEVILTVVASIQVMQIVMLPTWLDWLTNFVILSLIFLVGRLSRR